MKQERVDRQRMLNTDKNGQNLSEAANIAGFGKMAQQSPPPKF